MNSNTRLRRCIPGEMGLLQGVPDGRAASRRHQLPNIWKVWTRKERNFKLILKLEIAEPAGSLGAFPSTPRTFRMLLWCGRGVFSQENMYLLPYLYPSDHGFSGSLAPGSLPASCLLSEYDSYSHNFVRFQNATALPGTWRRTDVHLENPEYHTRWYFKYFLGQGNYAIMVVGKKRYSKWKLSVGVIFSDALKSVKLTSLGTLISRLIGFSIERFNSVSALGFFINIWNPYMKP